MKNQMLYKLSVLGAVFSFLPFFRMVPFITRICGAQVQGAMQLGQKFDGEVMAFIRGG